MPTPELATSAPPAERNCDPGDASAEGSLPGPDRWLALAGSGGPLDAPVLSPVAVRNHNAAFAGDGRAGQAATSPLTRRALVEAAVAKASEPLADTAAESANAWLVAAFVELGVRISSDGDRIDQATLTIDTGKRTTADAMSLADRAASLGLVLVRRDGGTILYLGRDAAGRPIGVGAVPRCPGSDDSALALDSIDLASGSVTGDGAPSTPSPITELLVIGGAPGVELGGVATVRPAAPFARPGDDACKKAGDDRLFVSPRQPNQHARLRAVATAPGALGIARLALFDPEGEPVKPRSVALPGPPGALIADLAKPGPGVWTAALGDGATLLSCRRIEIAADAPAADASAPGDAPVWPVEGSWTPAMEDLFAVFVERLFDYPLDEDLTWPNLHAVTRDRERNILYDHLGLDEDDELELVPDCADLPYTLRAYFAWKLQLPFGMHQCSRARAGRPPRCSRADADNLTSRDGLNARRDVTAFERFARKSVRASVHSSSGRTLPEAEASDFYPVPLSRAALRPGTLFADPYGHLLVVVRWVPQTDTFGALLAADAQPDGTVGRRRFWRGSFLFRPETDSGGAGFKAFRPWRFDADRNRLVPVDNESLETARVPLSMQQYRGSVDGFYDAMEALINPRPLDPAERMRALVSALEEQVARRVQSVNTGEQFMRDRGFRPIEMPDSAAIFLTSGPWEEYSTPSRDWRLLVALHTVVSFPDAVGRAPGQYGIADADAASRVKALRQQLERELRSRPLAYTRTDGSRQELSLADVVARRKALEMAYNPNDCVEIRWGAPEGSPERETCARRASDDQRARMRRYRSWFAKRQRPSL